MEKCLRSLKHSIINASRRLQGEHGKMDTLTYAVLIVEAIARAKN
jgi:hypothetical protein